jgi:hypothetical protein
LSVVLVEFALSYFYHAKKKKIGADFLTGKAGGNSRSNYASKG